MSPIHKLELAVQQLEDALKCYFEGRHHSALVLAAAAEQLFAGYVMKHGGTPAWHQDRLTITKIANGLRSLDDGSEQEATSEKDIGDLLNRAYNHSKHPGKSGLTVEHDPLFEAQAALDRAITNFDFLYRRIEYSLPDLPLALQFRMESVQGVSLKSTYGRRSCRTLGPLRTANVLLCPRWSTRSLPQDGSRSGGAY